MWNPSVLFLLFLLAARVDSPLLEARLAGDLAAPPEAALAVDLLPDGARVVAATTAEEFAALDARRGGVADATGSAQRPRASVRRAEVGRVLRVHEVRPLRLLDGLTLGHEGAAVVARNDFGGAVEALLEAVAHVAEGRHLPPAGAQGARPRQAVALALRAHEVLDSLHRSKGAIVHVRSDKSWLDLQVICKQTVNCH